MLACANFIFFFLFFFSSTTFAMHDQACFWLFKKSSLRGEFQPDAILATYGLKEGKDIFGRFDQSLVFVNPRLTPQAKLLAKFHKKWPEIELRYESAAMAAQYGGGAGRIRSLVRKGEKVVILFIPLKMLQNLDSLTSHLTNFDQSLMRLEALRNHDVSFFLEKFSSEGFQIKIENIPPWVTEPSLVKMRNRMRRHQIDFSFVPNIREFSAVEGVMGVTRGKQIELLSGLLVKQDLQSISFLSHEIIHATHQARFLKKQNPEKRIVYVAGENNKSGLMHIDGYKDFFFTDEVEAYHVSDKILKTPAEKKIAPLFLGVQLEWLYLIRDYIFQAEQNTIPADTQVQFLADEASSEYFTFAVYRETDKEVFVYIPRLAETVDQIGEVAYLKQVVDRRVRQLQIRMKLQFAEQARTPRAPQSSN